MVHTKKAPTPNAGVGAFAFKTLESLLGAEG